MTRTQTWILVLLLIAILECSCTNPNEATDPNVTVWRKKDSPIIVDSLVHVKAGETLRIEKGVTVLLKSSPFPSYYMKEFSNYSGPDSMSYLYDFDNPHVGMIRVDGNLEAVGTEDEPITLTRRGDGYWGAIYADTSSVINLKHCDISYFSGIEREGFGYFTAAGIWFNNSSGSIVKCEIEDHFGRSIMCDNSNPLIRYNMFRPGGVITIKDSSPVIDNNIMIAGLLSFFLSGSSCPKVINNTIVDYSEGITAYTFEQFGGNPIIMNNIFWELKSYCLSKGTSSVYTFEYNLVTHKSIKNTVIKSIIGQILILFLKMRRTIITCY